MILVERCHHQLITARPDRCWQVMQRIHCLHICSQQPYTDWPLFRRPNININLLVCGSPSKAKKEIIPLSGFSEEAQNAVYEAAR